MVANLILLILHLVSGVLATCDKKSHLSITTPQKMEALSGSCLLIPCSFDVNEEEFDSQRQTYGVWIKNDSRFRSNPANLIFNSSKPSNVYPMSISGNLTQKNCTTLFSNVLMNYTDTYFFRVENQKPKPLMATASCDPVQLTVKDSPWSPRIEISGDLKEKESVTITCSALTPCPHSPPKLTWNLQPDSHNIIEENKDGTFTTKIQKTITLSEQHDGHNITCSARYPVNEGKEVKTAEKRQTLSVSYAPKDTSVVIISSSGSWMNLSCSSRAKPPISHFTWFRKSRDGVEAVAEGQFISLNVTEGVYRCVAKNDLGDQTSSDFDVTNKGGNAPPWGAVVGGLSGIVVVLCVAGAVWLKSKRPVSDQRQRPTAEMLAPQTPDRAAEKEEIHYGEIDFSTQRRPPSSASVPCGAQDTLYAPVRVCKTKGFTHAAEPESIYAQVKKV